MVWERGFPRRTVAPAVRAAFADLPVAVVADAMGRLGVVDPAIRLVGGRPPLVGPATTVDLHPGDNRGLHEALAAAAPGDVLVVATGGEPNVGLFGELMLREAERRGIAGVVVDGAVRDGPSLARSHLPVYARGLSPRGAWKSAPARLNWPVALGGVAVLPGDVVLGDADGVAVVPAGVAEEVLAAARAALRREAEIRRRLDAGEPLAHVLGLDGGAP
jgi:regulator of RNase E activity RraA